MIVSLSDADLILIKTDRTAPAECSKSPGFSHGSILPSLVTPKKMNERIKAKEKKACHQ